MSIKDSNVMRRPDLDVSGMKTFDAPTNPRNERQLHDRLRKLGR